MSDAPTTCVSGGLALKGQDDSLPLFVYGSLLDEGFLRNLLGHTVPCEPAWVEGWEVVRLEGLDWPIIRPVAREVTENEDPSRSGAGAVEGRLLRIFGSEDYRRLDAYEGVNEKLYERTVIVVQVGSRGLDHSQHLKRPCRSERANIYQPTARTLRRWS